jgi:hypothetical protein
MKRYAAFKYSKYYPCGGMHDFAGSDDDLEELKLRCHAHLLENEPNQDYAKAFYQIDIWDTQENALVYQWGFNS